MNIYLIADKGRRFLKLPVVPEKLSISAPLNHEAFKTIGLGEVKVIGEKGLDSLGLSAFFPSSDYPFLKDKSLKGMDYVKVVETWIKHKTPVRLVIPEIRYNRKMMIDSFDYAVQKGTKDVYYNMELVEYRDLDAKGAM